jgi:hypothetical protein
VGSTPTFGISLSAVSLRGIWFFPLMVLAEQNCPSSDIDIFAAEASIGKILATFKPAIRAPAYRYHSYANLGS